MIGYLATLDALYADTTKFIIGIVIFALIILIPF